MAWALVAALSGCSGMDGDGPGDPSSPGEASFPPAPSKARLSAHLTAADPSTDPWADCHLVADDPPSTGSTEMALAADPPDAFFNGTVSDEDQFVPPGARQLAICSPAAEVPEFRVLDGPVVDQVTAVLNGAPNEADGACFADYWFPVRLVFRYADDSETFPLSVTGSGCGHAWNGRAERAGGGLRDLMHRLAEADPSER